MQKKGSALINGKKLQNTYQRSQIMGMNPVQLLIKVYDYVILHCKKKDMSKSRKGIVELISALNFEHEEVSLGLFRLYQYCLDCINAENYEEPITILQDLKGSWAETLKNGYGNAKLDAKSGDLSLKT